MRIVVVDDHPLVWQGIRAVVGPEPDMQLVGWASNGKDAEALMAKLAPDVVMMDLRLPGESGLDIIRRVKPRNPDCRFVVLTSCAGRQDVSEAMAIGVDGYMLKEALPEEMLAGLRLVGKGRPYFDPSVMQMMMVPKPERSSGFDELTEREQEVLRELAKGCSNKEIASRLYITEYTVKKHVSGILSKLDLKDRTQAALFAVYQDRDAVSRT